MAAFQPVIPRHGTHADTEKGFEPVIPRLGTYKEQAAAAGVTATLTGTSATAQVGT